MDTIEKKVQKLKELSRKQKKLNEIKQDIADILGNANIKEKKKIAEKMSKTTVEDINQERNLQFIVPHIVKELYEHNGPKGEFILPKKVKPVEPIAEEVEPAKKEPFEPDFIKPMEPVKPKIEKVEASPERIKILQKLHKYLPNEFFEWKKDICYPGSSIDVSLAQVFGKNVLHIDFQENIVKILQDNGYNAMNDNISTHNQQHDFVFDSRSQVTASAIDKLVKVDGYVLVENAHAHANYFYDSPEYELIANISTGKKKYKKVKEHYLSSGDTDYYLFKKKNPETEQQPEQEAKKELKTSSNSRKNMWGLRKTEEERIQKNLQKIQKEKERLKNMLEEKNKK